MRERPRFPLRQIKAACAEPERLNRTLSAALDAEALGIDERMVVNVIGRLMTNDFDKSMPSDRDPAIRQDVYRPVLPDGRELYVKFTRDAQGELLLISFKENDE